MSNHSMMNEIGKTNEYLIKSKEIRIFLQANWSGQVVTESDKREANGIRSRCWCYGKTVKVKKRKKATKGENRND